MNTHQANGMADEVVGSAKRKAGELTGNIQLEAQGIAQQVKGRVEHALGDATDAVSEVIAKTEVHLDAHVKLAAKDSSASIDCTTSKRK